MNQNYFKFYSYMLFLSILLLSQSSYSQIDSWAWVSGGDTINTPGVYGIKGVADITNLPEVRQRACTWDDSNGNLWLFGGEGNGNKNDLWKYDISTGLWTWVSGSNISNQTGIYGTQGIASATNIPGARYGSTSWIDSNDNLWLFGGYGKDSSGSSDFLNDLWKYDISEDLWTWVSGSNIAYQAGVYGTKGIASASNIPGARTHGVSWTDSNNDLWLFGGRGLDANLFNAYINDLWKYDVISGLWIWISGGSTYGQSGVYGTQSIGAAINTPGARWKSAAWTDSNNNLWLFGGEDYDIATGNNSYMNDLWKFDAVTGFWSWILGSNVGWQIGIFGTQGVAAATNIPGARINSSSWIDLNNDLWLFGGYVHYTSNGYPEEFNDFWKYDQSTGMWTWVTGGNLPNQAGIYGVPGLSSTSNVPGGREAAHGWIHTDNNFWLFGGFGIDKNGNDGGLNDLWRFVAPGAQNPTAICQDITVYLDANGITSITATDIDNGSNDPTGIVSYAVLPTTFDCSDIGTTSAMLIVTAGSGASSSSASIITVVDNISPVAVCQDITVSLDPVNGLVSLDPLDIDNGSSDECGFSLSLDIQELSCLDIGINLVTLSVTDAGGNISTCATNVTVNPINMTPIAVCQDITVLLDASGNATITPQDVDGGSSGNCGFTTSIDISTFDFTNIGVNPVELTVTDLASNTDNCTSNVTVSFNTVDMNRWTWMSGSSTKNQNGVYGTLGVPASTNTPIAMYEQVSWTDLNGDMWMFGGFHHFNTYNRGFHGDMWKYGRSTGLWTWMKAGVNAPVYGTQGVPDIANTPGARVTSITWTDQNGDLWLFGGHSQLSGQTHFNDLWRYNISTNMWTWESGPNIYNQIGVYGTKGVADISNIPGGRMNAVSFVDSNNNLWLYGGTYYMPGSYRHFNDLWMYNISTGMWTWVSGSNLENQPGVYGTQGVSDPINIPGARNGGVSWIDSSDILWLFGGAGYAESGGTGLLSDLWSFDVNSGKWTYESGSKVINTPGVYGTKGLADIDNMPGRRSGAVSWIDHKDDLWMFGSSYSKNDLWMYNQGTGLWTWVSGSNLTNQYGVYGTLGISGSTTVPGGRSKNVSWYDEANVLWLFGGQGYAASGYGYLNDLWKYTMDTDPPIALCQDITVALSGVTGEVEIDASELDNGSYDANGPVSFLASTTLFDCSMVGNNLVTLIVTDGSGNTDECFANVLIEDTTTTPVAVCQDITVTLGGIDGLVSITELDIDAGSSGSCGFTMVTDINSFDCSNAGPNQVVLTVTDTAGNVATCSATVTVLDNCELNRWIWMSGSDETNQVGSYGAKGVTDASNMVSARKGSVNWTDLNGDFWLFGGMHGNTQHNDVWKYEHSNGMWTWMSGSSVGLNYSYPNGVYGNQGIADPSNIPGSRSNSITWTDSNGIFWMFGGQGRDATNQGKLSDLWMYDPSTYIWTWVSGSSNRDQNGVYGTMGIADPSNRPGGREESLSWIDSNDNLWLFGGWGYSGSGTSYGHLSDLWKYDISLNQWTWVSGGNTISQGGNWGVKGVSDPANIPSGRAWASSSWIDSNDNLWLYGGNGRDVNNVHSSLSDLWKYEIATGLWTWVSGSNLVNQSSVFGIKGIPDSSNFPGQHGEYVTWTDFNDNLWLFSGSTYKDLWKYNIAANLWTWVSGTNSSDQNGIYGTKGLGGSTTVPGKREGGVSWVDTNGNLWLFGGQGYPATGSWGRLNDLWKYNIDYNPPVAVCQDTTIFLETMIGTVSIDPADVDNGSYDNEGTVSLLLSQYVFDVSNLGNNQVTLFVYDESGNGVECISNVFVDHDDVDPIAACQDITISLDPVSNNVSIDPVDIDNGSYDAFGDITMTISQSSFSCSEVGVVVVTLTVTDVYGNTSSCSSNVTVEDVASPTAICQDITISLGENGSTSISTSNVDDGSYGDCGMSTAIDLSEFNCFHLGLNQVTLTVTNSTGATSNCTSNVTVNDDNNPTGNWTWMSGSNQYDQLPVYTTQWSPPEDLTPGMMEGSLTWTDSDGTLWLYGGYGENIEGDWVIFDNMWKYDKQTNNWTRISGNGIGDIEAVYGSIGVSSAANTPGSRYDAVTWVDSNDNLWLFGGYSTSWDRYTDLWMYDISNGIWTWIDGDDLDWQPGVYGTQGVSAAANIPGVREYSVSWTDSNDNLWLFGGKGYDENGSWGRLNDLWKFDISTGFWTWVSGSSIRNQSGINGVLGVPASTNMPGGRLSGVSWIDSNNDLWLFGGEGYDGASSYYGKLNDLWKYNISTDLWTWVSGTDARNQPGVYGTKGIPDVNNNPGGREFSLSFIDENFNLWLFGGYGEDIIGYNGYLNDLWKYNISSNTWTWVSGSDTRNSNGDYGIQGNSSPSNVPDGRYYGVSWYHSTNELWLFSGYGYASSLNDLWKYDLLTEEWTWMKGDNINYDPGVPGILGSSGSDLIPGARENGSTFTDSNGNLWLFGGEGEDVNGNYGRLNDLWKYNIATGFWTWESGNDTRNQSGVYGSLGTADTTNFPGSRYLASTWVDSNNNLWMFGGYGYDINGSSGPLNDLWKYNIASGMWTWITGSNIKSQSGMFGQQGISDSLNTPGGRYACYYFTDSNNDFWLFGGSGPISGGSWVDYNDLWKYDISTNQWTWITGSNLGDQSGVYGTLGVAASTNMPGGREWGASWIDSNDNLWIFGGWGIDAYGDGDELSDLWKYDMSTGFWTWMSGPDMSAQPPVFGVMGVADINNIPPARWEPVFSIDSDDNLWLFAGWGSFNGGWVGNDLWKFDTSTNLWTWMKGSDQAYADASYGSVGISSGTNDPGSREYNTSWTGLDGSLWLFGGYDWWNNGDLNDLWRYVSTDIQPPTALCQDLTVSLDPVSGTVSISENDVDAGSCDNESLTLLAIPASFDCSNIGVNQVILTVTDAAGNTAECTSNVTVEDIDYPIITCPDDVSLIICAQDTDLIITAPVIVEACGYILSEDYGLTDNGNGTYTGNFHIGLTEISWTVIDDSQNDAFCTQTINLSQYSPAIIISNSPVCEGEVLKLVGLPVEVECSLNCDLPVGYCNSGANLALYQYIDQVEIGYNASNASSYSGYEDNTGFSFATMYVDSTYTVDIHITNNFNLIHYTHVFVDWNRDGDFDDLDESQTLGTATGSSQMTGVIAVPLGAAPGKTVLRIVNNANSVANPCGYYLKGETEDYMIEIKDLDHSVIASYSWSGPNGWTSTDGYNEFLLATTDNSGIYNLSVTNIYGCETIAQLDAIIANPQISLPSNILGTYYPDSIVLDPGVFDTYLWSTGETTQILDITDHGLYELTVTEYGCTDIDSILITEFQNIPLDIGWSIWSTYIDVTDPIDIVLSEYSNDIIIVKDADGSVYWPYFGLSMIGNMEVGNAYLTKMSANRMLVIYGLHIVPETFDIILPLNWSHLGYLRMSEAPSVSMLSSIVSNMDIIKNDLGLVYWPGLNVNMLGDMIPGEGYKIKMNLSSTLVYSPNITTYNKSDIIVEDPVYYDLPEITGSDMTLGIPLISWSNLPQYGDEIVVYDSKGNIVGVTVFTDENIGMSIWGNDDQTTIKDGMDEKEELIFHLYNRNTDIVQELSIVNWTQGDGTYHENSIAIVGKMNFTQLSNLVVTTYPNPFTDVTTIEFILPQEGQVQISLYDVLGNKLQVIAEDEFSKGLQTLSFDASGIASGNYYIKVESNGEVISTPIQIIE